MKQHMWVSLVYTPVSVELLTDDTIKVFTNDTSEEIAAESALIGCWFCHTPLTRTHIDTACIPEVTLQNSTEEP
jgi:hypothetical protein